MVYETAQLHVRFRTLLTLKLTTPTQLTTEKQTVTFYGMIHSIRKSKSAGK